MTKANFKDISMFTRQLATLQTAGIALVQGLQVIIDSTSKPIVAKLISNLKCDIEAGDSLSTCLRHYPREFNELYCNLVAAGESSGSLDLMLQRIATYREKEQSLKRKLKKALYYPLTVLTVAILVTAILLIKVVPTFKTMFAEFNTELPAYTKFILQLSEFIINNGLRFLSLIIAIIWVASKFKHSTQILALKIPIFGNILHQAAVARFSRTLATTFAAGVPLPNALVLVAKASGNIMYYNAIMQIRDGVSIGKRINIAMAETKLFPSMLVQMITIGEESGSLDFMLLKAAAIYEEEVEVMVDSLATLLEPVVMVLLGAIVGGLVLAMYLPIFTMGTVF